MMSYTLDEFCNVSSLILKTRGSDAEALSAISDELQNLLTDEVFVAGIFEQAPQGGKRVLYHDPEVDFYVLAHWQPEGKTGKPHSNGASWAIYGNAKGFTEMTEWRRVNAEDEEQAVLEVSDRYKLVAGRSRAYGPGVIHSTGYPQAAWIIRVTGTNLDVIPRYHFQAKRDKLLI
jgi:hypothetical protein